MPLFFQLSVQILNIYLSLDRNTYIKINQVSVKYTEPSCEPPLRPDSPRPPSRAQIPHAKFHFAALAVSRTAFINAT